MAIMKNRDSKCSREKKTNILAYAPCDGGRSGSVKGLTLHSVSVQLYNAAVFMNAIASWVHSD